MSLSHARLLEVLDCDMEKGRLLAKRSIAGRGIGSEVGTPTHDGYIYTKIDGKRYPVHRLIWFHVHGKWPDGPIDHINGDRSDNRLSNLRDVPHVVNSQNLRQAKSHNQSGFLGVAAKNKRFYARIASGGRTICLGTFNTQEEAHAAYVGAKKVLHIGSTL